MAYTPTDYGATLPMGSDWRAKYTRQGYTPQGWTQQGEQNFYMNQEAAMGRTHAPTFGGMQRSGGGQTSGGTTAPWQSSSAQGMGARMMGGMGGGGGNMMNVSSGITPRSVYTPEMTNAATNMAVAEQHNAASLPGLLKQFDRPSVSRGPGSVALAMPQMVNGMMGARMARAGIPLEDEIANQRSLLRGQVAQGDAENRWGGIGLRMLGDDLDYQTRLAGQQNQLAGLFGNLFNFGQG